MIHRIYVEKREGFRNEAEALMKDLASSLGIRPASLRILRRYDVEGIGEELFRRAVDDVFSEKAVDLTYDSLPEASKAFAICPLPGQFDLCSHSAEECIAFLDPSSQVRVKAAKVYLVEGLDDEQISRVEHYLVNPVESMLDSLDEVETLARRQDIPTTVETLEGFTQLDDSQLADLLPQLSLAMDVEDLKCFRDYFRSVGRNPTVTELRVCDTYWSDHCRHTTFLTQLDEVDFLDSEAKAMFQRYLEIRKELGRDDRPVTLMDIATIGARHLASRGLLGELDESEEINACSIRVKAQSEDGRTEDHLLMFKNETHNHPTEIEPFGGAATCIGGAIRDPLSGRAYVYQAMRITGSGDVHTPYDRTLPGKLPQKKIAVTSAQGYSSYGNQIGLATGLVDEVYHPGYVAKHLELGAVVAAVKADNVVRKRPEPGDLVILVGGRTGRDGIGGATGSSKSHKTTSVDTASAEVQKGNAPEERKLQRLFRNSEAAKLIKRCNDFGAGGVSVAIGELAPGLVINLDKVTKKYQGLDGTELAISESQERMAVVCSKEDAGRFIALAEGENLEATVVAEVSSESRLCMDWAGRRIVDIERSFLDTNGAPKHAKATVVAPDIPHVDRMGLKEALRDLHFCSRQGLAERFDSTIGAGTVLMPFGGRCQKTPSQVMCATLPSTGGRMRTASLFSYGFNADECDKDPFRGAYDSVLTSVAKIVAAGGSRKGCYLSLQEYFGRTGDDRYKWGRPLSALLGALKAQLDLSVAAIGGKDSMSGSFEDMDVPNTLVAFAINTIDRDDVVSNDIKKAGSLIHLMSKAEDEDPAGFLDRVQKLMKEHKVLSAALVERGRADVTLAKMCFGSMIGFTGHIPASVPTLSFLFESDGPIEGAENLGRTTGERYFNNCSLEELLEAYESRLEDIYPQKFDTDGLETHSITSDAACKHRHCSTSIARPRVLIPVFPGTNCEVDSALAFDEAGAESRVFVINNLSGERLRGSIEDFAKALAQSQILFIPGGFSGGDEPDGSGKFITAFLRSPAIRQEVERLVGQRDGLIGGICNGFQALVKLGLLPFGEYRTMNEDSPTLTHNLIGRHQSRLVHTRVSSLLSPWLSGYALGEVQCVPVSHGEGRFIIKDELLEELAARGQIATQYVDDRGLATMDCRCNPNGSTLSIEGICSPDGRIFGRMGHIERCRIGLYRNVETSTGLPFFKGAVDYFS